MRLANVAGAQQDGSITWTYTYVHTAGCAGPRLQDHQRPDTGAWDPTRGIGSRHPLI